MEVARNLSAGGLLRENYDIFTAASFISVTMMNTVKMSITIDNGRFIYTIVNKAISMHGEIVISGSTGSDAARNLSKGVPSQQAEELRVKEYRVV